VFAHLRRSLSDRRLAVIASLAVLSLFAVAMIVFRILYTGSPEHSGIAWNLALAWIPLALALIVYERTRSGPFTPALGAISALWLLFLPNAPYIVTDFVHLSADSPAPLWLDGVELSAFAWTGMLLGFVSLYLVHAVARHRFGPAPSWIGVLGVLALVSVGVYLGRVKRWNSWDLLTQPGARLAQLQAHLGDPASLTRAAGITFAVTCLLAAAYLVFYVLMGVRLETSPGRASRER
jgi:uncharacterized membrane protein